MRRDRWLALFLPFVWPLVWLGGCAGVDGDIKRAELREGVMDLVKGRDRGVVAYRNQIRRTTIQLRTSARYQYAVPAHVSYYLVDRSVRGLGGTTLRDAGELCLAVDQLLDVIARDPTAGMRASACHQIGRILLRLEPGDPPAPTPQSEAHIHEIASDLLTFRRDAEAGKPITIGQVIERMQALGAERPVGLRSAREVVRALASPPIAGNSSAAVKSELERIARPLVRDAILVALGEVACGRPETPDVADDSPLVRQHAAEVLTRVASPVALGPAALRLRDPLDPSERNEDVRRQLLQYMGAVGGDAAFAACVERLDDFDSGVRYHAHGALVRMTGATQVEPTRAAWNSWKLEQK